MEDISRSIYALESKQQLSAEEEQQLQQLHASRSQLLVKLKQESAAVAAAAAATALSAAEAHAAAASHAPSSANATPPPPPSPSFFDSVVSSVVGASTASAALLHSIGSHAVGGAKAVAGLLVDSVADTARHSLTLCALPPPTLHNTMKELEGGAVPPCVLHLLPEEFVRSSGKPCSVPDDAKQLLSNYCEYSLLMDTSVHGCSNKVFHQLCDAQGPTLALLHVGGGHLFGYYLSKSSGMGIQRAPSSFLFTVFKHGCFRPDLFHMLSSEYQVLPQPSALCTHYVTCVHTM